VRFASAAAAPSTLDAKSASPKKRAAVVVD
jgi:hypothetical protein